MTQYLNVNALVENSADLELHQYYLEKSKDKYADRFEYNGSIFNNPQSVLNLTCKVHNHTFEVSQRQHFRTGHGGCEQCCEEIAAQGRIERFLTVANEIHGDKFDYSALTDATKEKKLNVICREHGQFEVAKQVHLHRPHGGCAECEKLLREQNKNVDIADQLTELHKGKFDYSETDFKQRPLINVRCKKHGVFSVELRLHKRGVFGGCEGCLNESISDMAVASFVKRAKEKFGDQFDYSLIKKLSKSGKVQIICTKHGQFEVSHYVHLGSDYGSCKGCKADRAKQETLVKIKEERGEAFFNQFSYEKSVFNNTSEYTTITCLKHGDFKASLRRHLEKEFGCCDCCENENKGAIKGKSQRKSNAGMAEKYFKLYSEKHGDRFDYSQTIFEKYSPHINVICRKHGLFQTRVLSHLDLSYGGCLSCKDEQTADLKVQNYIERAKGKHGENFDYSKVTAADLESGEITIICPTHGKFKADKQYHMRFHTGMCKGCVEEQKRLVRQERFVGWAVKRWGQAFDYSDTRYVNKKKKIKIRCIKHKEFSVLPIQHLKREFGGCPSCKADNLAEQKVQEYIQLFINVHGDIYDYGKVRCTRKTDKIKIKCLTHGMFTTTALKHSQGVGCPKCGKVKLKCEIHGTVQVDAEQHAQGAGCPECERIDSYINRFKEANGDLYDYSQIISIPDVRTPLPMRCTKHGVEFKQSAIYHLNRIASCEGCVHDAKVAANKAKIMTKLAQHLGENYDLSQSSYEGRDCVMQVVCKKHGEFSRSYMSLMKVQHACEKCGEEALIKEKRADMIARCREIHGDKYKFSKTVYVHRRKPVEIICEKHGLFKITPEWLLAGGGCKKCAAEDRRADQIAEAIKQFVAVHGDKYDYSGIESGNSSDRISVRCPEHGIFRPTVTEHINGVGCHECKAVENYITRFKNVHGDKYDYSLIKRVESFRAHLPIRCIKHDSVFTQSVEQHLQNLGCKECQHENMLRAYEDTALKRLADHLGDGFDVSQTKYNGREGNVDIICKRHGVFTRRYATVFRLPQPCYKCSTEALVREKTQKMVARLKTIHGDKLNFSRAVVTKRDAKIEVICKKHGSFEASPVNLLQGHGCPHCYKESRYARTRSEWIQAFKEVHGNRYSYHYLPEHVAMGESIKVTCLIHSHFITIPENHLRLGCPKCRTTERRTKRFWSALKEKYADRIQGKLVQIESYKQYVTLTCSKHGVFIGRATNILNAKECCPTCRVGMNTEMLKEYIFKRFGDRIITTTVLFLGWKKPVRMHCRIHGAISTTAEEIMKDDFDCPSCKQNKLQTM